MSTPVSNLVTRFLSWNDQSIMEPLMKGQFHRWIGTFPAVATVIVGTITAIALGIFASLATFAGAICKLVGAKKAGSDLLNSSKIALFGPSAGIAGATELCHAVAFSFINAISFTIYAQYQAKPSEIA